MSKLWSGRFAEGTDDRVQAFTESISYDYQLYPYDISLSIAYSRELESIGILTATELQKVIKGLKEIQTEIEQGKFNFQMELEDIHMNIEAALTKKIGNVAKKIHTGKSRNDQVATDVRMYCKDRILFLQSLLKKINKALIAVAEKNSKVIMPGYTHLQVAQPILFAHHLAAYVEMFLRDCDRLADIYKRTDVMPLGSAALAGTTYPINRKRLADNLGFAKISENSLDAVSDRDFIIEFQAAAAVIMLHLSRMSEELVLWNSQEFKFVELSDRYATGSSIMPQKKNPDIPELVRGKTGKVIGALMSIMSIVKSLPLAYNRDLQEDKEALFKVVKTVSDSLVVMTGLWETITINSEKMYTSADKGYSTATDLANYLVAKGVPFRDAHEITGSVVKYCIDNKKLFSELSLAQFQKYSPLIQKDIFKAVALEASVQAHDVYGGTAPNQVQSAFKRLKKRVEGK